jgi:hypothetical protein
LTSWYEISFDVFSAQSNTASFRIEKYRKYRTCLGIWDVESHPINHANNQDKYWYGYANKDISIREISIEIVVDGAIESFNKLKPTPCESRK